ncbi:MAG: type II toxin-antitoxin system RelE/ParE family toxin [Chloroflexi bacterium]|nr:type II toxin-antitoxin system RelE/ParE family toxin [Chloroflexota bacterium]MCY3588946.1 type II toxin-antitoxin system RelE/ParE family toxin [Chloroflexota bacterium]MCY3687216.1 type II toxin-antitoxin system RelE/ParE family toxin [Chloroflexota bacterium]MDE2707396.1 type II toxin-antitoxin system RelE/ParE family toxin [Chloroflexota bacterium]
MEWEVEYTDEFEHWWLQLLVGQQEDVGMRVEMLRRQGPNLPFPHSSSIRTSRHGRMRELRVQSGGRPIRVFYAFDPRRTSILLIGGDKTGNDRFYEEFVPLADRLYDEYLIELRREGLI